MCFLLNETVTWSEWTGEQSTGFFKKLSWLWKGDCLFFPSDVTDSSKKLQIIRYSPLFYRGISQKTPLLFHYTSDILRIIHVYYHPVSQPRTKGRKTGNYQHVTDYTFLNRWLDFYLLPSDNIASHPSFMYMLIKVQIPTKHREKLKLREKRAYDPVKTTL